MGRHIVSADWHGAQWAWNEVKNILGPEDTLYFLGDSTDRGYGLKGDGGWTMLKEMLQHPRVIYIAGNHDIMLADAITRSNDYQALNLCYMNGGMPTVLAAEADPESKQIAHVLRALPKYHIYTRPDGKTVFMSHSGSYDIDNEEDLIWDRTWYIAERNWSDFDYIIHGHTGAKHINRDLTQLKESWNLERQIPSYNGGAYWHNSFACDVDCTTISSNQIVLLDLDTFAEEIINAPVGTTEVS